MEEMEKPLLSSPQEMLGLLSELEMSPLMHLLWKVRLVSRSRLEALSLQVKPEKALLP